MYPQLGLVTVVVLLVLIQTAVGFELRGIENCPNKCDKVFDRTQYSISDQPGQDTFEFRSCIIGCNHCQAELAQADLQEDNCFNFCKTFDYGRDDIRKGVIEPDKACLMGCVINTCQKICFGGTTDNTVTDANRQFWWGLGGNGCSIKSSSYVQNPGYGNPNSPAGAGVSREEQQCCTNAYNLCFYHGNKNTTNFANVDIVARRSCAPFVPGALTTSNSSIICDFYNQERNCGTIGMSGTTSPPT